MRRKLRLGLIGAVALVAVAGAIIGGPRLFRELPGFEVRFVEVSGTHLLSPDEVLRAAGIHEGQSVWDDPAGWEEGLTRHPAIASAEVTRSLPGTLRLRIEEKRAVAYVEDGSLAPVTAAGERLPIDPTLAPADLPIARGAEGKPVPARLLSEAERLTMMVPGLLAEVSEIRASNADGSVLLLRHRRADIVIPTGAPAARLEELRAVLADLGRKSASGDAVEVARVDLRFADQIVVRPPPSVQMP